MLDAAVNAVGNSTEIESTIIWNKNTLSSHRNSIPEA